MLIYNDSTLKGHILFKNRPFISTFIFSCNKNHHEKTNFPAYFIDFMFFFVSKSEYKDLIYENSAYS